MRAKFSFFLILLSCISGFSQEKVNFYASDSLKITADLYLKDYKLPFILLFHQDGSNRGEYRDIAPRLLNLGYNCIAVDMRSGDNQGFTQNETAQRATEGKYQTGDLAARNDILAAINYAASFNKEPVVLFGSGYSASLCLMVAVKNPHVKAVVAFSPGEYFLPNISVQKSISGLTQPVFIAATSDEYNYVLKIVSLIPEDEKTIFKPKNGKGQQGARALWKSNPTNNEYWFELMMFFKKLR